MYEDHVIFLGMYGKRSDWLLVVDLIENYMYVS